ncbi:MAG: 6-phosphofructokinase [Clostridiales bacterium]|jgi:6-phosphofructokinase 1|nr:6-phosphofructokinase [Clostridiales bacterium]
MSELKGAAIFAQSGGPTSVINASAAGVITEALKADAITHVYGSAHGIRGMLDDVIYDMSKEDGRELELLLTTPSSALGSARYKLKHYDEDDRDYKKILDLFRKYDIRYFFFNGGNDSMDTCSKIGRYLQKVGYECRVFGVPKTIDNDLWGTDHCPGFGSAAKYIVTSFMEVALDAKVYDTGMVIIIEVMGRNAGWLTAASSLASQKGLGPDLIYLPELPFEADRFLGDVESVFSANGNAIIAISEGLHDADGVYVPEMNYQNLAVDSFGHTQLGGAASILGKLVKDHLNVKVRSIELSLLQRCAAHCASRVDVDESFLAGKMAVQHALEGKSGYMVGFERGPGPVYVCNTKLVDVNEVANKEKLIPREWVNEAGNGLKQEFCDYALPLIQGESRIAVEDGLPRFARLRKVRAS